MNRAAPHIRKLLAAEYVVGTLHGRARQRFERLMAKDGGLRSLVAQWQGRLQPLDMQAMAIEPHPRVKQRIDARIAEMTQRAPHVQPPMQPRVREVSQPAWWSMLWSSVNAWRFAAAAAGTLALVFALRLLVPAEQVAAPEYIAVLMDNQKEPALVLRGRGADAQLTVAFIKPADLPSDRDLELWALPEGGKPRSLGVLQRGQGGVVAIRQPAQAVLHAIPALAVSVEPRGGSATGAPTGPVILHGKLTRSGAI